MSQFSCPLCRRALPANVVGQAPGSRLCDQCRSIVQEAFPGPASRNSVSTTAPQPHYRMATIQQDATVLDLSPIDSPEFIEDDSSVEPFEQPTDYSSPTLFELDDDLSSDRHEGGVWDAREHLAEAEYEMFDNGFAQARAGITNHNGGDEPTYIDNIQADETELPFAQPAATFTKLVSDGFLDDYKFPADHAGVNGHAEVDTHVEVNSYVGVQSHAEVGNHGGVDLVQEMKSAEPVAVADPWQEPLPPWDYSQNEWPVLMGQPKRNHVGLLRVALGALVLLAAAGFYFFILQPTLREQRASAPVNSNGAELAAAVAQPKISEAKAVEISSHPVAATPPAAAPAPVETKPAPAPADANTNGKFSLQAASFPNRGGADQFAEKLKQAGVPSYTVSADLGRRGTWFRVRVGRFNSAEDAQKFASEAQLRAKAAGVSLQLIGCQYDQP